MNRDELAALHAALAVVLAWPDSVRAEVARWLAPPPATKPGNGLDLHPPSVARTETASTMERVSLRPSPTPYAGKTRRAKPTPAQAAEKRLLTAMRDNPGLSVNALASAANASRSATGERLRQLGRRGVIEKGGDGRWRLAGEEARLRRRRRADGGAGSQAPRSRTAGRACAMASRALDLRSARAPRVRCLALRLNEQSSNGGWRWRNWGGAAGRPDQEHASSRGRHRATPRPSSVDDHNQLSD